MIICCAQNKNIQHFEYKFDVFNTDCQGAFTLVEKEDKFEIWGLGVPSKYRRKGYATQMLLEFLSEFNFKKTLSLYEKKFKKSFMYQDLKSYKNVVKNLRDMSDSIFRLYPQKLDEFLTIFNTTDTIPKVKRFRKFFNSSLKIALKDGPKLAKTVLEVLK